MLPALTRALRHIVAGVIALALGGALATAQTTVLPSRDQSSEFQVATKMYRDGQYSLALEHIDAWLKPRPRDARGRFLRGMIFSALKKPDEAARIYTDLTQEFPELPEPYNNLAVIYAERGELERAREFLESAVRANPRFAAAHENLGDIHARLAAASYERALMLNTENKVLAAKLRAANELAPSRAPPAKP
jgi:Flp pilus assembly protein TadD